MLEWIKFSDKKPRANSKVLTFEDDLIIECIYYGTNPNGIVLVERYGGHTVHDPVYWAKKPELPRME
jgi:hypothetical protein